MAKKTRNINTSTISYQGQRSWYKMEYPDQNGNQWRVDVMGDSQAIRPFVEGIRQQPSDDGVSFGIPGASPAEKQPFSCYSVSLTPEEIEEYKQKIAKELKRLSMPAPPSAAPPLDSLTPAPSPMEVKIAMMTEMPGPYRVSFIIDPQIRQATSPQKYTFMLYQGDSLANVSYIADGGTISVGLGFPDNIPLATKGPGNEGRVQVAANAVRTWQVTILWGSSHPEYTLRGDLTML